MKRFLVTISFAAFSIISFNVSAQLGFPGTSSPTGAGNLYLDVHKLKSGKINYNKVAIAHAKDLAAQGKYGVQFLKYWVDEKKGIIYCLSSAGDSESIRKTHAEAHGLLPDQIYSVTEGQEAPSKGKKKFFLDVHEFGAGKVSAKDVAEAHKKDLSVQQKYGVNFINYWVDEKAGMVVCLSEAKDSNSIIETHKDAHGLLPAYILKVKQGE